VVNTSGKGKQNKTKQNKKQSECHSFISEFNKGAVTLCFTNLAPHFTHVYHLPAHDLKLGELAVNLSHSLSFSLSPSPPAASHEWG
jgi:hypothetical protein